MHSTLENERLVATSKPIKDSAITEEDFATRPVTEDCGTTQMTQTSVDAFAEELLDEQFKYLRGTLHSRCRSMVLDARDRGFSSEDMQNPVCPNMQASG